MNKFEFNEFLNQFVEIIEEGGSKLKAATLSGKDKVSINDIAKMKLMLLDLD